MQDRYRHLDENLLQRTAGPYIAIDGVGVVLGRIVLAEGDLAAGRLVRPFKTVLPLDVSYFLVRSNATAPRPEILSFRNWLFSSLKQASLTRSPSSSPSRNA